MSEAEQPEPSVMVEDASPRVFTEDWARLLRVRRILGDLSELLPLLSVRTHVAIGGPMGPMNALQVRDYCEMAGRAIDQHQAAAEGEDGEALQ